MIEGYIVEYKRKSGMGRSDIIIRSAPYEGIAIIIETKVADYYEQLDAIFDEMAANDNDLLAPDTLKRITILGMRTDRYLSKVCNLQEIVSQMREAYQSQLSIQQNDLMKVFTIVTVLFLPLTLLTGWYGMNFIHMPELQWRFSYPVLIAISLVVVLGLVWYFKRKKWL